MIDAPPRGAAPVRVLYVAHTMAKGGSASSLRLLVAELVGRGVEAHLLAPPGPSLGDFERLGVRVHVIPAVATLDSHAGAPLRGRKLLVLLRALAHMRHGGVLRRVLREVRPDLVHLNERGMLHAAAVARRAGFPVVMHARSVYDRETPWFRQYLYAAYRRDVTRMIAIDGSVRESLREIEHCDIVYNPLREPASAGAQRVPHPEGTLRVTFLSGLMRYKGIWDLLEAARLLRSRDDIVFRIAGANARPREFYRSLLGRATMAAGLVADLETAVARYVAEERLEASVHLLGHVDQAGALLADTDVLVFPSHLNGPGRSIFEAGVVGIPSIVSMKDRVEDVVVDGVNGLIVPEGSPAALADAIARLADDAALRARLGEQARERYARQFDPARSAAGVLAVYDRVLAGRPGQA